MEQNTDITKEERLFNIKKIFSDRVHSILDNKKMEKIIDGDLEKFNTVYIKAFIDFLEILINVAEEINKIDRIPFEKVAGIIGGFTEGAKEIYIEVKGDKYVQR